MQYEIKKDGVVCHFEENQIKAYQLLHILLHEIGHHHDRINTRFKNSLPNGENYAESYAVKYEKIIWNKYFDTFNKESTNQLVNIHLVICSLNFSLFHNVAYKLFWLHHRDKNDRLTHKLLVVCSDRER